MQRRVGLLVVLCAGLMFFGISSQAGVTRADYQRAAELVEKYKGLALNIAQSPVWINGTDTFVYNKSVEGGHTFVRVDAIKGDKQPAFDHARLAAGSSSRRKNLAQGLACQ